MERETFKKWEYVARIDPDIERAMMQHKQNTNRSYNEMINTALREYLNVEPPKTHGNAS